MRNPRWKIAIGLVVVATLSTTAAYADHVFDDLPDERFYADAAEWAKDNGITVGCNGGADFCGEDPVTRGENITFAKRYHDNIAQPAIDDLQTQVDELETATVEHGVIVLSHGTDTVVANAGSPPSSVSNFVGGSEVAGDGAVQQTITGPQVVGGVAYGLRSIEYCISSLGATTQVERVIVYDEQGLPFGDPTDRTAAGCYVVEVNIAGMQGTTVLWEIAGGDSLRLQGLTSTWAPQSSGGFTTLTAAAAPAAGVFAGD